MSVFNKTNDALIVDTFKNVFQSGPSANLECRSEMRCTRLTGNTGPKKIAKNSPSGHHRTNFIGLYLRNDGTYRQSEKTC